ncbi:hypothetical protein ACFFKU_06145 [Kineococcus gynurae]|uniref:Uncharacterized protein n=1 Tax=Kineococcus gynurae TaxID=452979 RepID=A0ABV5LXV0_9ACTN
MPARSPLALLLGQALTGLVLGVVWWWLTRDAADVLLGEPVRVSPSALPMARDGVLTGLTALAGIVFGALATRQALGVPRVTSVRRRADATAAQHGTSAAATSPEPTTGVDRPATTNRLGPQAPYAPETDEPHATGRPHPRPSAVLLALVCGATAGSLLAAATGAALPTTSTSPFAAVGVTAVGVLLVWPLAACATMFAITAAGALRDWVRDGSALRHEHGAREAADETT